MLISSIVIVMAYTAYQIIGGVYRQYQAVHEEMAVMLRLDEVLRRDIRRADELNSTQDGIRLTISGSPISYHFLAELVLRESAVTDSFQVKTSLPVLLFEGVPLTESTPQRPDELSFNVFLKEAIFPYHYRKQYSSQNLIQPTSYAFH